MHNLQKKLEAEFEQICFTSTLSQQQLSFWLPVPCSTLFGQYYTHNDAGQRVGPLRTENWCLWTSVTQFQGFSHFWRQNPGNSQKFQRGPNGWKETKHHWVSIDGQRFSLKLRKTLFYKPHLRSYWKQNEKTGLIFTVHLSLNTLELSSIK